MRVLFAVDLGEGESHAQERLAEGALLLDRLQCRIDLVFVDPMTPGYLLFPDQGTEVVQLVEAALRRRTESQEAQLLSLLSRWPPERRGRAIAVSDRKPADTVVAMARDYDLLVVATHGRRGLARAWLGSVAEKVVRSSPIPVLVLHSGVRTGADRVLAAIDLREGAEALIADAGREAERLGAVVDLITVVPPPAMPDPSVVTLGPTWAHAQAEAREAAQERLARLLDRLPQPIRGTARVEEGDPAIGVAAAAEGHQLVVIRTHGRRGLGRLWLGSVAERLVRQSPVPILVLPSTAG